MHSMTACPRQTVYASPCLGSSGSQAGWVSFIEKDRIPSNAQRPAQLSGVSPAEYQAQPFPFCLHQTPAIVETQKLKHALGFTAWLPDVMSG